MLSSKHKFSKSVYDMELHEELVADPITFCLSEGSFEALPLRILRVPGGWMYYNQDITNQGVFVPFNNEFMSLKRLDRLYESDHTEFLTR